MVVWFKFDQISQMTKFKLQILNKSQNKKAQKTPHK
jgi:hypothetical protein